MVVIFYSLGWFLVLSAAALQSRHQTGLETNFQPSLGLGLDGLFSISVSVRRLKKVWARSRGQKFVLGFDLGVKISVSMS